MPPPSRGLASSLPKFGTQFRAAGECRPPAGQDVQERGGSRGGLAQRAWYFINSGQGTEATWWQIYSVVFIHWFAGVVPYSLRLEVKVYEVSI